MSTDSIFKTKHLSTNTDLGRRCFNSLVFFALVLSVPVFAEETVLVDEPLLKEEQEDESPFTTLTKLGFIYSQNTSSSLSINSGISVGYKKENWGQRVQFDTYYTDAENDED